jgi:putative ABC transport system substrate-binding protein
MRRIGVLMSVAADDPEGKARFAAFQQGLQQLGWTDGRNVRIETRWAGGNADDIRRHASELVMLAPDVLVAAGSAAVGALQQATRTIPIVFATAGDPVGAGFVDSLARPGGNITGFAVFEYAIGGKWLALLKDVSPRTWRFSGIRRLRLGLGNSARYKPRRPRLVWRSFRLTCASRTRSSVPLPRSRNLRTVV